MDLLGRLATFGKNVVNQFKPNVFRQDDFRPKPTAPVRPVKPSPTFQAVDTAVKTARKIVDNLHTRSQNYTSPVAQQNTQELSRSGVYDPMAFRPVPVRAALTDFDPQIKKVVDKISNTKLFVGNPIKPEGFTNPTGKILKGAVDFMTGGAYSPEEQAFFKKNRYKEPLTPEDIEIAKRMQDERLNALVGSVSGPVSRSQIKKIGINPIDELPLVEKPSAPSQPSASGSRVKLPQTYISKIEEDSFNYLKNNLDELEKQYLKNNKNVINPDSAKELFEATGYNKTNAREVHEPSSQLAKIAYEDSLLANKGKGDGAVLFTAGGSGVGKTTAIKQLIKDNLNDASIIYDSNLSNIGSARVKVQQALDNGYVPEIVYVYRDPVKAWNEGVLTRTARGERHVPIDVHVGLHKDSRDTLLQLKKDFGDKIKITVIDNSGLPDQAKIVPLDFLEKITYNEDEVKRGIYEATRKAIDSKRLTPDKVPEFMGTEGSISAQKGSGQKTSLIPKPSTDDLPLIDPQPQKELSELEREALPDLPLVKDSQSPSNSIVPDELPLIEKPPAPEAPPGMKERGFIETVRESPTTAQPVAEKVRGFYKILPNKETIANAKNIVDTNLDEALRRAKDVTETTAEKTAIQLQLMNKFQNEGNYEMAVDIAEAAAKHATSQGQAIQALSMWGRLTPEGALRYAARIVNKFNEGKAPNKRIKISPEQGEKITKLAKEASEAGSEEIRVKKAAKLTDEVGSLVPSSFGQRLAELQTMAQLLNPKTAIRNIMGNFGFAGLETVKDLVAYPIDIVTSVATGKRTKVLPSISTQLSGGAKGLKLGIEEALDGIDTANMKTIMDLPKKAMTGKVANGLRRLLNLELKAPDRAFFQAAYDESVRQAMKAAKVTEPTEEMVKQATYDGLYRTFQDDNMISKAMQKIKQGFNVVGIKGFGLGDLVLKYPKTPGAILARAIDYSPAGFVKSVFELARPFVNGEAFSQKRFVDDVSRALVGTTGLVGTGALLHKMGIITGAPNPDYDISNLEREKYGVNKYRLNASALLRYIFSGLDPKAAELEEGDMVMSYDWFQPQAVPLAMGADVDAYDGSAESTVSKIAASFAAAGNTLVDQPLLTGLQDLFSFKDLGRGLQTTAENLPSSFTPTLLNQIKQLIDNTQRNTTDPDSFGKAINKVSAKTPVFSSGLPARVGSKGQDLETYQDSSNNFFNVLFNPAFVGHYKSDPVGDEVLRLFNESGETTQAPRSVPTTITINKDGKPYKQKLTGKQQADMQRYVGQVSNQMLEKLVEDERFDDLTDDEKAKKMADIISDVMSAAKYVYLGHKPKNMSKKVKAIIRREYEPVVIPAGEDLPLIAP